LIGRPSWRVWVAEQGVWRDDLDERRATNEMRRNVAARG
jgi:hypothetical protein